MGDEAHVGLVDAHPERHCRHNHHVFGIDECCLISRADPRFQPRVIGQRRAAARRQLFRDPLGFVAAGHVDDPRPGLLREEPLELPRDTVARLDPVADVGPIETGNHQPVLGDAELRQYVRSRACVGGRGQRQPRHVRIVVQQRAQLAVIGPEVVPPFADAMRFVDRDQRQIGAPDQAAERLAGRTFRRDIEEVELAVAQPLDGPVPVGIGRRQRRRAQANRIGAADLVVHQRDQRRDDQRGPVARDRRQLVAKRLACAGRHHRERVLASHDPFHDRFLDAAKMVEAEDAFEELVRVGHFTLAVRPSAAVGRFRFGATPLPPQPLQRTARPLGAATARRRGRLCRGAHHGCRARRSSLGRARRSGRLRRRSKAGGRS